VLPNLTPYATSCTLYCELQGKLRIFVSRPASARLAVDGEPRSAAGARARLPGVRLARATCHGAPETLPAAERYRLLQFLHGRFVCLHCS